MEENSLQRTESYELAIQGMQTLGECGDSLFKAAGQIGTAAFDFAGKSTEQSLTFFDNSSKRRHERKMQELQNRLHQIDLKHNEMMTRLKNDYDAKMTPIANAHEERMLQLRNEHEKSIIAEQAKVLEMLVQAAIHVYDRKMDFFEAQLNCLEETYRTESRMIDEHIHFLEDQRRQSLDNAMTYSQLSSDLDKLNETKARMFSEYTKSQGNLSDKIELLKFENSLGLTGPQSQNLLLGAK